MDAVMETTTATATTTERPPSEPDALQGFLTNEEWDSLLVSADELIQYCENLENEED